MCHTHTHTASPLLGPSPIPTAPVACLTFAHSLVQACRTLAGPRLGAVSYSLSQMRDWLQVGNRHGAFITAGAEGCKHMPLITAHEIPAAGARAIKNGREAHGLKYSSEACCTGGPAQMIQNAKQRDQARPGLNRIRSVSGTVPDTNPVERVRACPKHPYCPPPKKDCAHRYILQVSRHVLCHLILLDRCHRLPLGTQGSLSLSFSSCFMSADAVWAGRGRTSLPHLHWCLVDPPVDPCLQRLGPLGTSLVPVFLLPLPLHRRSLFCQPIPWPLAAAMRSRCSEVIES